MLELCTPRSRQQITMAVLHSPESQWRGHRKGISIKIWLESQPTFKHERIHYRFTFQRKEHAGTALTVSDALEYIGRELEKLKKGTV